MKQTEDGWAIETADLVTAVTDRTGRFANLARSLRFEPFAMSTGAVLVKVHGRRRTTYIVLYPGEYRAPCRGEPSFVDVLDAAILRAVAQGMRP